MLKRNILK